MYCQWTLFQGLLLWNLKLTFHNFFNIFDSFLLIKWLLLLLIGFGSLMSDIFPKGGDFITFLLISIVHVIDFFFYLIGFGLKYFLQNRHRYLIDYFFVDWVKKGMIDSKLSVFFQMSYQSVQFLLTVVIVQFSQQTQSHILFQKLIKLLAHLLRKCY